ncbi:uncharacterized protein K452DRAFT_237243 [Aplosporella prunicola CBS 121167]|uniref:ATPase AAA-type core domain-containing protein n=1 Tax=Aplosporella prunicola CBS 121167 TaxID=1176127 RepID=A0A6A6AZC4_9PEZI|nr:uncharacterized protein K452DRAFT_237243 [Aplosporella prunicola CBS 121167]KAF2136618.1 hypothetical protein K452DRAFT_237243 [Aplosporella prunicola CBS 121167]
MTVEDYGKQLLTRNDPFDCKALATIIQHGCDFSTILNYLQKYGKTTVGADISMTILLEAGSWHVLFFAIERNCPECVRALLDYGTKPNTRMFDGSIPAVAFAIMLIKWTTSDSTNVVKTLLEYGTDPIVVPKDLWAEYLEVPQAKPQKGLKLDWAAQWCKPEYRSLLVDTMHLGHRYSFFRASLQGQSTTRKNQMAEAHKINALFHIPHRIVGQGPATKIIMDQVFAEFVYNNLTPLVMVFAGPPGHGKTELSKQMGDLLSVQTMVIDCAQVRNKWQLFGATAGYQRSREGSPLNNFLSRNDGERCAVFLDEFDKTVGEVWQALLRVCESGSYIDRTTNTSIDCSKVIWILASNLGHMAIQKFYSKKMEHQNDRNRYDVPVDPLQKTLRGIFKSKWSSPFVSRIRVIVPFFPFSPGEQAVIFHEQLLAFANDIRRPIDIRPEVKRYIGHCHLAAPQSTEISKHIASLYYDRELGARAYLAIDDIKVKLLRAQNEVDRKVTERTNDGPLQRYTCQLHAGDDNEEYVELVADGSTEFRDQKCKGALFFSNDTV